MIEMLLGAMVLAAVVTRVPAAVGDFYEARKAAKAGEWAHLDKMRAARDARSQRRADWGLRLWDHYQQRAAAKAAGHKPPGRPGFGAWAGEVWHGAWEDALDRSKRRDVRPAFDPATPTLRQRAADLLKRKVAERRAKRADPDVPEPEPADPERDERPDGELPEVWCANSDPHASHEWRTASVRFWCSGIKAPSPPPDDDPDAGLDDGLDWSWVEEPAGRHSRSPRYDPKPDRDPTSGSLPHSAGHPDATDMPSADPTPSPEPNTGGTVTTPTAPPTAPVADGTAVADVHTNEALRQAAASMQDGAARLAEAAAQAEAARAQMASAAQAASDAVASTSFDGGATAASHAAADAAGAVSDSTISQWCEKAEAVGAAETNVLQSLEKYLEAEDLVASNRISGKTLEPTAS